MAGGRSIIIDDPVRVDPVHLHLIQADKFIPGRNIYKIPPKIYHHCSTLLKTLTHMIPGSL